MARKRSGAAGAPITDKLEPGAQPDSPGPTDADVAVVRTLGERMATLEAAIAGCEAAASVFREERDEIARRKLPDAMMERKVSTVGLASITPDQWLTDASAALLKASKMLDDPRVRGAIKTPEGEVLLVLSDDYYANIAADWEPERREAAFKALDKLGFGAIVRTQFVVHMPRGSGKLGAKLEAAVRKVVGKKLSNEVACVVQEQVPWTTLTALVREQTELNRNGGGVRLPLEVLGARVGKIAKLASQKKRK